MGPNQTYKVLHAKETTNNKRGKPTDEEKIFANDAQTRPSFPKYANSSDNLIKTWAEKLNRQFSKEAIQKANRHMKRCPILRITGEMQMQTTVGHLMLVRMAIIKKSTNNKRWREFEKKEPVHTTGGIVNWCSPCGRQYGGFSKN